MDKEIIIKRLNYISEKLEDIQFDLDKYKKAANSTREQKTILAALERWSEESVESAVNINNELLKEIDEFSDSYYNSFIKLDKLNIFKEDELKKLASTAGFRNRLAHEYMELDEKITVESIKNILKLYKIYITKIQKYIS